ncbi:hypothetical protein EMIT0P4_190048 [Pseudomonas sp. IT-P4]
MTPFSLHERSQAFVCDRKPVANHPLVFPSLPAGQPQVVHPTTRQCRGSDRPRRHTRYPLI